MSESLLSQLKGVVDKRRSEGKARVLTQLNDLIDFSSNDYLGMARSRHLRNAIVKESGRADVMTNHRIGSTGSRLLSGNNKYYEFVESHLAKLLNAESALIFNSGYDANLGLYSTIAQEGDCIIFDELAHNSIREGIKGSKCSYRASFKHNNVDDLRQKIESVRKDGCKGNIIVGVEGVYSMDGDVAPLNMLQNLCETLGAVLIVDEAHSTGVKGRHGEGVHTFGKAPGVHGAVVLGSHILKDYLLNYAKSIIYTTALSTHSFVSIKCSYDLLKSDVMDKERSTLMTLVEYFRSLVKRVPSIHLLPSNSPIHGVLLPGNARVMAVARYMRDRGFHLLPIRGPTVPEGKERLRITIHSYNTMAEIETLVQHLESASMMFSSKM